MTNRAEQVAESWHRWVRFSETSLPELDFASWHPTITDMLTELNLKSLGGENLVSRLNDNLAAYYESQFAKAAVLDN